MGSELSITKTSSVVLTTIFQNSPYWKIENLKHRETKTPFVCLSLKGTKSLRFSTPLSQKAAERQRYGSQIKLFMLGFWIQEKRLMGLIMFLWLCCWLRNALNMARPWSNRGELYQVSSCWQIPWLFVSDPGKFLCSSCTRCYRGTGNSSRD